MILLLEFLVLAIDRETKNTLHEFRRFAMIEEKGSMIRARFYNQHDFTEDDDCGLAFSARQSVLSQLCSRDAHSADNPFKEVADKMAKFPWALDSMMVGRHEFENKELYYQHLQQNPDIEDALLW